MGKPRKIDIINSQAQNRLNGTNGQVPDVINDEPKEIPELETLEKQREILSKDNEKPKFIVPLSDGNAVELPNELTVADVLKNRTFEQIWTIAELIIAIAKQFNNDLSDWNECVRIALKKQSVREELEKLIARVTDTPLTKLEANISNAGTQIVYYWMSEIVSQNKAKSGESNDPKDK
jgi:hypothetical protein